MMLAGAVFELENVFGAIQTGTTDAAGEHCFRNLPFGQYTVRETVAPTGYQINPNVTTINLTRNESCVLLEVLDLPVNGTVTVTAVSATVPSTTFPGIVVNLVNSSMQAIATATTNASGVATFANVPFGTYTLIPLNTPAGYVPPGIPATVTVSQATPNPSAQIGFMQL